MSHIAIDLGGTKILSSYFDAGLNILATEKMRTPGTTSGDDILELLVQLVTKTLQSVGKKPTDLLTLGVAVPGAIHFKEGIVLDTPNIGFKKYPLKDKLKKVFKASILIENDVNAGVYGEFYRGAAKGYQNIIGIYPGTGIGGGIILDGKLIRGNKGAAGEFGHIRVQDGGRLCGCGRYGCLETVASKTSLAKDLVALAATGKAPSIALEGGTDITKIKSGLIRKSVLAGEKQTIELLDRFSFYLGIGMANMVNVFDPDLVVLGGGMIEKLGEFVVVKAIDSMKNHAQSHIVENVKVKTTELGDLSVVTGLAALQAGQ